MRMGSAATRGKAFSHGMAKKNSMVTRRAGSRVSSPTPVPARSTPRLAARRANPTFSA
jgi:hypothetical protein